ncbi:MAG: hypothetical protein AVDCRST_MAG19-3801 [uncultured Thermomicrobiales bacterium]|uniref:DUF4160 domain-containing protein n=1 Tax=uncultured Thermomicrobiales bacterium TaxID=1645740 RepID=A0A6J4VGP1_9BACT|nr:MAG: hypothetical protein AVDCRST_MAG19-3801 [uncultured Thermomicrobiales bacterium]
MVWVVQRGRFGFWVDDEQGDRHRRPHDHVRWSDGEASADVRAFDVLAGEALPTVARRLVEDHEADIVVGWDRLGGLSCGHLARR